MEMKKRGRRKGEGLALMEECLFYSDNNMVQKVCMRRGQKWMAAATTRCAEVKETWGRRRQSRAVLHGREMKMLNQLLG